MKKIKYLLYFLLFIICSVVIGEFVKKRRLNLLSQNTNQIIAKYGDFTVMRNRGPVTFFTYKLKNEVFTIDVNGKYDFLQKGDTVIVKYSIEDPSVATVVEFCYMKNHKGKDYCDCKSE